MAATNISIPLKTVLCNASIDKGLKAVGYGALAGLVAIPFAKLVLWCGKKVLNMAYEKKDHPCKQIALKIAAFALFAIGTLSAIAATLGLGLSVGFSVALVAGSSLGIFGTAIGGVYGGIIGGTAGVMGGAVAAGGVMSVVLNHIFEDFFKVDHDMEDIDFAGCIRGMP